VNPTVNARQIDVLRWIAAGSRPGTVPTVGSSYKATAYALQNRGLVSVVRKRGQWRAEVTERGRYFLEHGFYPPKRATRNPTPSGSFTHNGPREDAPVLAATTDEAAVALAEVIQDPGRFSGVAELPIVAQIRRPHPAIRELLDHPNRIDLPAGIRRRAHLISHTLVGEAVRRGWKVIPVHSEMRDRWPSGQERSWPSPDLLRIDAGEQELGIRFRVKTARSVHAETVEEARRRNRGEHVYTPGYDYAPTDTLRLALYHGAHQLSSWDDKARTPVESSLLAVLDAIEASTQSVRARRENERRRWEEEQRQRKEEQRQQQRVEHYDAWRDVLVNLQTRLDTHAALTAIVNNLEAHEFDDGGDAPSRAVAEQFVTWARQHLEESHPYSELNVPVGDSPDMTYTEWTRWKRYFERHQHRGSSPWS
jgi:hypothetical protein